MLSCLEKGLEASLSFFYASSHNNDHLIRFFLSYRSKNFYHRVLDTWLVTLVRGGRIKVVGDFHVTFGTLNVREGHMLNIVGYFTLCLISHQSFDIVITIIYV